VNLLKKLILFGSLTLSQIGMAVGPSIDHPTEFQVPPVGTKIQYKNLNTDYTYTITVRESEDDYKYSWFTGTGDQRTQYMFCLYCSSPNNQIELEEYAKLFPLDVGKKIKLQRKRKGDRSKSWSHKIKVKKTEMLQTSFRDEPFETYLIVEKIRSNKGNYSGSRTIWYAPEISNALKIIDKTGTDGKKVTYEVIDYILP